MRLPIICLSTQLDNYLRTFRHCFSKPQYKYFVTLLLGLMLCQGTSTMTNVLRQVENGTSLSGMSRFFSEAPWSATEVANQWMVRFRIEMGELVKKDHARQKASRPNRKGRPRKTVVTGYLIGDDSAIQKRRGKKMGGIGYHHSSTEKKRVKGHCLVQALYVLLGRRCPLEPLMYTQKAVCKTEKREFRSKVAMMIDIIANFVPVEGTKTHVLLDSWYTSKKMWKAARERGFLITSGLKCDRSLRIDAQDGSKKWHWQRVDEYAATLKDEQFTKTTWPNSNRIVYVHVVSTRVKKLYRSQVIFVRETLDGKTRYWASTDLDADMSTLLAHIAQRWDIEQLFADVKELLGLDQYQLMSHISITRFWVLSMLAYTFLDQQRDQLKQQLGSHITIGDAWRHTQQQHYHHLLDWIVDAVKNHRYSVDELCVELLV